MSNGVGIHIRKRDGELVPLDINKIHFVVEEACEGLSGVSASQIEMTANIQFYDGMSTAEIQEILIRSANDLISLENPNYQYAAARLLLYPIYKESFGQYQAISLDKIIKKNIERGVYDSSILDKYTITDLKQLNKYIKHKRDENFTTQVHGQVVDKYLVQDRSTGEIYESPVFMYMMIAATIFADYPKEKRLSYVRRYYDATSLFKNQYPDARYGRCPYTS